MATLFLLMVFAYFVTTSDANILEKLVLAVLCAFTALAPMFVVDAALPTAIAQGLLGVYVCLRMTYLRAKA